MRLRTPLLDLSDSVVVVTGATSGIGRATARHLAERGATIVLGARDIDALDDVARECHHLGARAMAVPTDVSERSDVARLARAALDSHGHFDAWINDAGVMTYGRFHEVPVAEHEQVVATNLLGTVYGTAAALPEFLRQGRGVLVNVASLYAEISTPFVSSYVASKFGILGLTRVLQRDLRHQSGVAACCIMPSSVDTPIFRHAGNHRGRAVRAIPPAVAPERVARAIVRCLEHPKREVRVGYAGRLAAMGERFAGPVYDHVVERAMDTVGFRDEKVAEHPGNLFAPTEEWQQVDGEWRSVRARSVLLGAAALSAVAAAVLLRRR